MPRPTSTSPPAGAPRCSSPAATRPVVRFVVTPAGVLQTWSDGAVAGTTRTADSPRCWRRHAGRVRDALVVPGGRLAATVGRGGEVVLWDISAKSGAWSRRESLPGHSGEVVQVEVSGDGTTLFTVSQDGMLITWDLTGTEGFGGTYGSPGDRWISNRIQVVDPGRVVVAPARTPFGPGASAGNVAALFLDPRSGREIDRVKVSRGWGSSLRIVCRGQPGPTTRGGHPWVRNGHRRHANPEGRPPGRASDQGPVAGPAGHGGCGAVPGRLTARACCCARMGRKTPEHLVVVDTATWRPVGKVDLPGVAQVLEWSPDHSVLAVGLLDSGPRFAELPRPRPPRRA